MDIYKELKEIEYYQKRMSMFLNESLGIKERVNFLVKFLNLIDNCYDELIKRFNIEDEKYNLNEIYTEEYSASKVDEFLDIIGNMYNISRNLSLNQLKLDNGVFILDNDVKTNITLTNYEFLQYIKLTIIKLNFIGSREVLAELYGGENPNELSKLNINFIYSNINMTKGECDIYWNNYFDDQYDNYKHTKHYYIAPSIVSPYYEIKEVEPNDSRVNPEDYTITVESTTYKLYNNSSLLFMNGLLTIESLGIIYNKHLQKIDDTAIWDSNFSWDTDTTIDEEPYKVGFWS